MKSRMASSAHRLALLGVFVIGRCRAFLVAPSAFPMYSTLAYPRSTTTSSHPATAWQLRARRDAQWTTAQRWKRQSALGAASEEEEGKALGLPSANDMMDDVKDADFIAQARAKASGPMGPATQPPEDKRRERQEREEYELSQPKENKWASGAFKRGVALQVRAVYVIASTKKPVPSRGVDVRRLSADCDPELHDIVTLIGAYKSYVDRGVVEPVSPPCPKRTEAKGLFNISYRTLSHNVGNGNDSLAGKSYALVLGFVIYLQFQPKEVTNLAICAPLSNGAGCVGFGQWLEIVFLRAPIPPM